MGLERLKMVENGTLLVENTSLLETKVIILKQNISKFLYFQKIFTFLVGHPDIFAIILHACESISFTFVL